MNHLSIPLRMKLANDEAILQGGMRVLSIPLRMKRSDIRLTTPEQVSWYFQFLWGWNLSCTQASDTVDNLSIPLRMKLLLQTSIARGYISFNSFEDETWFWSKTQNVSPQNLSIPLRMKQGGVVNPRLSSGAYLSIPLRMKLIYFYSLIYTLEDKLINISHHSLDLSCELGPHGGTTSSCSHGLLHKLKERGGFIYV